TAEQREGRGLGDDGRGVVDGEGGTVGGVAVDGAEAEDVADGIFGGEFGQEIERAADRAGDAVGQGRAGEVERVLGLDGRGVGRGAGEHGAEIAAVGGPGGGPADAGFVEGGGEFVQVERHAGVFAVARVGGLNHQGERRAVDGGAGERRIAQVEGEHAAQEVVVGGRVADEEDDVAGVVGRGGALAGADVAVGGRIENQRSRGQRG